MSIPELFIRRPVMTTLVMSGILLFGVMSFRLLPVNALPNVDYPTIQVSASLPGASPSTMASSVATPLEKQFSTIAGVDSMTSVSAQGVSQITLQFTLERSIDAAAQDVQSAISKAGRQLPPEMPTPPSFSKVNPADSPVLLLALSSPTLPLSTVDDYGESMLAQQISMIAGVAQVGVFGSQPYAVRVQLDPGKLAALGVGIDEVQEAISAGNVNLPTGTLYGKHQVFTVLASGQLQSAADFRPLIVSYRKGCPIRLEELGNVADSVQNNKVAGWFNNTRAIVLTVQRQPGVNTVEVVDAIKKLLPHFRNQLPPAVNLEILFDRSESIRDSVHDVEFTLLLTVGLVVLVIFLFLRNLSGHADSESGVAAVHRRHVCGDGVVELQPGQPVADGADAVGGFRGGRCHRDARKHRASHGIGRSAVGGGVEGFARNRFHHHFDDAVAGGGVSADPVHERIARAVAA